ncbi:hypothetical protein ASG43_20600 [Aureimonas sp. Leaf454]|uniref:hypothetical protein n=1 Tax=Aureimonas sp. Leaf454 TaxID=1736381 RepID=UPI00070132F9|nr:hypothetical protein [Aureimonas sp. Leaf454]KQT51982.1 hypothetical protein ASG43_20600 [Aureimonas sp. Leaf454]
MQTLVVHVRDNFARVFVGRMIEWEHSIGLFLFGLSLMLYPPLFDTAAGFASFRAMHPSADFWGLVCMSVGTARFLVLTINGTIRRSPHLRAFFAAVTAFFWFQAAYGAVVADRLSPVTLLYMSFVGWEFVIFLICMRYAKLEDIKAVARDRPTHA